MEYFKKYIYQLHCSFDVIRCFKYMTTLGCALLFWSYVNKLV